MNPDIDALLTIAALFVIAYACAWCVGFGVRVAIAICTDDGTNRRANDYLRADAQEEMP